MLVYCTCNIPILEYSLPAHDRCYLRGINRKLSKNGSNYIILRIKHIILWRSILIWRYDKGSRSYYTFNKFCIMSLNINNIGNNKIELLRITPFSHVLRLAPPFLMSALTIQIWKPWQLIDNFVFGDRDGVSSITIGSRNHTTPVQEPELTGCGKSPSAWLVHLVYLDYLVFLLV